MGSYNRTQDNQDLFGVFGRWFKTRDFTGFYKDLPDYTGLLPLHLNTKQLLGFRG